ncbi:acyltransferase family protein [Zooshikella marina]|uniref:acyltransferase n=1 Tax=Zooshikella ganghwensis TaxID=202772 RepID=UPI001BB098FA|nr:acyltransferase family protein [Zooshikella ganghwensis]MBU2709102.1 acyltransferase family protein [Zooshikella ganghwensis]
MNQTLRHVFYIDVLRCLAALAVIAIHVLGPLRELYNVIPLHQWLAAVEINALMRWAVPIFIMISGALLLQEQHPFNLQHYLTRRVVKVVIPFLAWSVIYALIAGYSGQNGSLDQVITIIENANNEPTWYHLWFFYDFIPLYFIIPLLALMIHKLGHERIKLLITGWLLLTLVNWLNIETPLRVNIVLYSGYLIFGWYLANHTPIHTRWLIVGGLLAAATNLVGSWYWSMLKDGYSSFFMGYKTLNTVLIAGMIFTLCKQYSEQIPLYLKPVIAHLARYSLGIYLLHPIILIPIRDLNNGVYDWFGHNIVAIPFITCIVFILSYGATRLLSSWNVTRWLVP